MLNTAARGFHSTHGGVGRCSSDEPIIEPEIITRFDEALWGGLVEKVTVYSMPKNKPDIVTMPSMNYIAVRGQGDPNTEDGEYKQSIGLLYGIAFTIKMSKKGDHQIDGYFDYVVPPLEGFWRQDGVEGIDYAHKEKFK